MLTLSTTFTPERLQIKKILLGRPNSLSPDVNTYMRSLAEVSSFQQFTYLCKLLELLHKESTKEISMTYEAEFNFKLKCQKLSKQRPDSKTLGCPCLLSYSIKRANIDYEKFVLREFRGRLVTPFTLWTMDFYTNYGSMS